MIEAERARAEARCAGATEIVVGSPATAILAAIVDHDADYVVMGGHGRAGAARFFLGSVTESVVRRAPVPVTVVK